jgi:hypothetical protein
MEACRRLKTEPVTSQSFVNTAYFSFQAKIGADPATRGGFARAHPPAPAGQAPDLPRATPPEFLITQRKKFA